MAEPPEPNKPRVKPMIAAPITIHTTNLSNSQFAPPKAGPSTAFDQLPGINKYIGIFRCVNESFWRIASEMGFSVV
jgi:hypothetical protein